MVLTLYFCFAATLLLSFCHCQTVQYIELSREYNFSTNGNLIPNIYFVPINSTGPLPTVRIVITSEKSLVTNPLTLVAVRGKNVLNVNLPRIQTHNGKSFQYWFTTDTMCEDDINQKQLSEPVRLSVASADPATYTLKVKAVYNFDIGDASLTLDSTPPEPRFHRYTFPKGVDMVAIRVTSASEICARIMARKAECPVFDASGLVEMSNVFFYQTFTKNAYFTVKKKEVGEQFHLIYTVYPEDTDCGVELDLTKNIYRIKRATITIEESEIQDIVAVFPLFVYFVATMIVLFSTYFHSKWLDRQENNEPCIFDGSDSEATVTLKHLELFQPPMCIVSHKQYEKQRIVKQSKYFNFLYFQIFGAMLPAMTTLFQNRFLRYKVMNLDACNINFQCSFEILGFQNFNSMASASSLVFVGIVNLLLVFRKRIFRSSDEKPTSNETHGLTELDAPKVVCILSMIALGVFWTITSSCLQKTSIHLYVYTLVWVCLSAMMWIYSKRHGVRKWQQTFIITVSSILAVFVFSEKNLENGKTDTLVMKVLLSVFCNFVTLVFCYKYCYERPSGLRIHQWISSPLYCGERILRDEKDTFQPLKCKKVLAVILILWTVIWSTIVPFVVPYFNQTKVIIRLVQVDLVIYLFYYVIQKIRYEKRTFTLSYIIYLIAFFALFILSIVAWGANVAFKNTSFVTWPAAKSLTLNRPCILPGIDWNDILHYTSSVICITFIFLMDYIDTNIKWIPKKFIFVF